MAQEGSSSLSLVLSNPANDTEKVPKPNKRLKLIDYKVESSEINYAAIRTCMSPKKLFSVLPSLSIEQKNEIRRMGFGSLLSLQIDSIPSKLGYWVVDNLDAVNLRIKTKKGLISISKYLVHAMLGIPIGGLDLDTLELRGRDDPLLKEFYSQFPGNKITPSELVTVITTSRDVGPMFRMNFITLFVNTMCQTMKMGRCVLGIVHRIIGRDDIDQMDWCSLVMACVAECKDGWFRDDPKCFFVGPLTPLALLYVDATHSTQSPTMRQRPALLGWTSGLLKTREHNDLMEGGFGIFHINQTFHGLLNILYRAEHDQEFEHGVAITDRDARRTDSEPQDVQGFIGLVEAKYQEMEALKANILSYVNQGLNLFPQNEMLKWRSKLSGPNVSEEVTENVGGSSDDRMVVSVKEITKKYDRRKGKEPEGGFDIVTPATSKVLTPIVLDFSMNLTQQMDDVIRTGKVDAGMEMDDFQQVEDGKRVCKVAAVLCSPYVRRHVSVDAKLTAVDLKISRSLFAMMGDIYA